MTINPSRFAAQLNGRAINTEQLTPLAFAGYAHFTAMQVRDGGIRGLDLHLTRLRNASLKLFGRSLSDAEILAALRAAVHASSSDHSLVATIYSSEGEFAAATSHAELQLLVRTGPASSGPVGPLSFATFEYERILPGIKHVGEIAKTWFLRKAIEQGFDDAIFTDRRRRLSEGSIWNLAFWDGSAIVWPEADMLDGTTMMILRRQLDRLGIPQRKLAMTAADLPNLSGAAVMNSWTPGIVVDRIGEVLLPASPAFMDVLHRAYLAEPLVAL